jgi:hypothetical protein
MKDVAAIVLSVAALAVSISTLYVTQFRVTSILQARLAEFDYDSHGNTIVRFMVTNEGNRPAILVSAHYIIGENPHNEVERWDGPSYDFNEAAGLQKITPVVLQPRDVRLIEVGVASESVTTMFAANHRLTIAASHTTF